MEYTETDNTQSAIPRRNVKWLPIVATSIVLAALVCYILIFSGLPDSEEIKNYIPKSTAKSGNTDWNQPPQTPVRIWRPLREISPQLQQAVVLSEDDLFYQHNGVNLNLMLEAFKFNWEKGRYARGAGTITMQFVRNAFLTKEKTILRKIREIILAWRVEKHLTKNQILERYLNLIEWGRNIYGVEAAARYYFAKSAANLNLSEAALLAGMLPNPVYFNPLQRLQSCKKMQKRVLWLMQVNRKLTQEEVTTAFSAPLYLKGMVLAPQITKIDSLEEAQFEIPNLLPTLKSVDLELPDTTNQDTLSTINSLEADSVKSSEP